MLRNRTLAKVAGLAALMLSVVLPAVAAPFGDDECPGAALPDLRTQVPDHLNWVNNHQREELRFSNVIVNFGAGPLEVSQRKCFSWKDWTAAECYCSVDELLNLRCKCRKRLQSRFHSFQPLYKVGDGLFRGFNIFLAIAQPRGQSILINVESMM